MGLGRWYGKHVKGLVEHAIKLDAVELRRQGLFNCVGRKCILHWGTRADVEAQCYEDRLVLSWRYVDAFGQRHSVVLPVWLEYSACRYGGRRPWLLCPKCGRRVRVLYLAEHSIFSCRACAKLNYRSTRQTKLERLERQVEEARRKLNGEGEKRGPYRKTRERLQGKIERMETEMERRKSAALVTLWARVVALKKRVEK